VTAPTFNPAYRVARCGQQSAHGPHVMEHGPDQPRNCPGTAEPTHCTLQPDVRGCICQPWPDCFVAAPAEAEAQP
jgi:hypothetical protein